MKKILILLALSWLVLSSVAGAETQLNGYVENDLVGLVRRTGGGMVGDLNTLRLRFECMPTENYLIHLEPEYQLLFKTEAIPITGASNLDQLVWDRAYAKFYLPQVDITLGKQRIAWGTGYIWNPIDVLNPFTLSFVLSLMFRKKMRKM